MSLLSSTYTNVDTFNDMKLSFSNVSSLSEHQPTILERYKENSKQIFKQTFWHFWKSWDRPYKSVNYCVKLDNNILYVCLDC